MDVEFVLRGHVEVPEIPITETVVLPADRAAIVVVDMQNDFVKPEGSLTVEAAQEIVPFIRLLLEKARMSRVRIAYTQDTAVPEDPEFDIWPSHCLEGTWGWEIIEELKPHPEDKVFKKNRYDAFYDSGLDHYLTRLWKVEHLVIVGTVSNICVLHTAASAGLRWFHVVVPANGIGALTAFGQALTLHQVSSLYNGDVVQSVEHVHFQVD
ncbi:MAG: cysteine hydrolase [Anaerolineae bacterium]|nr:cysteine hydrolase [Anaerolineae bacterium]